MQDMETREQMLERLSRELKEQNALATEAALRHGCKVDPRLSQPKDSDDARID